LAIENHLTEAPLGRSWVGQWSQRDQISHQEIPYLWACRSCLLWASHFSAAQWSLWHLLMGQQMLPAPPDVGPHQCPMSLTLWGA
jgi:hypothetical protein